MMGFGMAVAVVGGKAQPQLIMGKNLFLVVGVVVVAILATLVPVGCHHLVGMAVLVELLQQVELLDRCPAVAVAALIMEHHPVLEDQVRSS
jgi:hypothetical protein